MCKCHYTLIFRLYKLDVYLLFIFMYLIFDVLETTLDVMKGAFQLDVLFLLITIQGNINSTGNMNRDASHRERVLM